MSRLTLLHRDLSRRIESLKQIVAASKDLNTTTPIKSNLGSTGYSSGPQPLPSQPNHQTHDFSPQANENVGDMHSIDLNPNTNQLIIKCTKRKSANKNNITSQVTSNKTKDKSQTKPPIAQRGESLDEGFESDIDTISLISTESTISLLTNNNNKSRETDSANGSASSDADSDDSDGTKSLEPQPQQLQPQPQSLTSNLESKTETENGTEIITEYFNLVNCVCYTDSTTPDVLILAVKPTQNHEEETLIFKFENPKELEAFHENFSTIKAVSSQNQQQSNIGNKTFNLLQRTDSDGMTHIRISRQEDYEEDFTSIISLPNLSESQKPKFEKFATMGNKPRRYGHKLLKKSKSIEDFLGESQPLNSPSPLKKIWTSAENILDCKDFQPEFQSLNLQQPIKPPRKQRKKGPAPPIPSPPVAHTSQHFNYTENLNSETKHLNKTKNLSKSFTNLLETNDQDKHLGLGNVFQGQFVRVQVDTTRPIKTFPNLLNFRPKSGPEILKFDLNQNVRTKNKVQNFDAFKFSDPKNLNNLQNLQNLQSLQNKFEKDVKDNRKKSNFSKFFSMYKPSAKKSVNAHAPQAQAAPSSSGTFTNRLFGMSSKLKEFGSLQSGCNPNQRYHNPVIVNNVNNINSNPYAHPVFVNYGNLSGSVHSGRFVNSGNFPSGNSGKSLKDDKFFNKLGRLGRSGSLGNLTLLNMVGGNDKVQSNTLKSVIKKKKDDEGRFVKNGGHGKKVTFSAYNTVQVV